jgi:CubicO group peptidase (beta-lactamase class C family)
MITPHNWHPAVFGMLTMFPVIAAISVVASQRQNAVVDADRVDAVFLREIRPDTPGCAVGVYRNGEVVLARGYGTANIEDDRLISPRTTFNLGSASKPFTSLAVLLLEQRGRLSMDDDVRRWVPELPDYGSPIRVRDLLQHTSGLRDFETLQVLSGRPVNTQPEFLGLVTSQRALNFEPGTRHEYSHTDYGVLGLIVERVAGVPFGQHLQSAVFEPIGMKGSFVDTVRNSPARDRAIGHIDSAKGAAVRFPDAQTFGGDNVYSSVEDLAQWDRALDKPDVEVSSAIARIQSRPALASGETIPYAYGLRLGTYRGLRTISRGGHPPGTRVEFLRFPEHRLAVATLCNSDRLDAPKLARTVADLYLGAEMSPAASRPQPPVAAAMSPNELAPYAGVYRPAHDPWDLWRIELRGGVLGEVTFDGLTDEAFYAMTPAGQGRFFEIGRTGNVGIFTFTPAAAGAALRLEVSWNDGPVSVVERVPEATVWRPSASAVAEYAGLWFSRELDAGWQLEARGARLVLRRPGQIDLTLRPVSRDGFLRGFGRDGEVSARLQFHRDNAGRLTELTVSTPSGDDSVRDLRLTRLDAQ